MMNLKTDWVKNKGNTILNFNLATTILIFVVLFVITFLFLSKPLGIIFGSISIIYLTIVLVFIYRNKDILLEKYKEYKKNKENEELS